MLADHRPRHRSSPGRYPELRARGSRTGPKHQATDPSEHGFFHFACWPVYEGKSCGGGGGQPDLRCGKPRPRTVAVRHHCGLHTPCRTKHHQALRPGQCSVYGRVYHMHRTVTGCPRARQCCRLDRVQLPPLALGSRPAMPVDQTRRLVSCLRLCTCSGGFLVRMNNQLQPFPVRVSETSRFNKALLTSNLVIDLDYVKCLAADGATVCLSGPCFQAAVV